MIYLIVGQRGSGKTTFLVIIANENRDKQIVSNVSIDLDNIEKFDMSKLLNNTEKHKLFLIDEASLYLDKRRSMSDINIIFSYFQYQSRKYDNDIYFAIQDINILDLRTRKMIDLYIYSFNFNDRFEYHLFNSYNQYVNKIIIEKKYLSHIFSLFDTHEIINNERTIEFISKYNVSDNVKSIFDEHKENIMKELKEYNEKLSEKFIKFYLKKHNLPANQSLIQHIYFELKRVIKNEKQQ